MHQGSGRLPRTQEDLGKLAPRVSIGRIGSHQGLELRQVTVIEHTLTLATTVRD